MLSFASFLQPSGFIKRSSHPLVERSLWLREFEVQCRGIAYCEELLVIRINIGTGPIGLSSLKEGIEDIAQLLEALFYMVLCY